MLVVFWVFFCNAIKGGKTAAGGQVVLFFNVTCHVTGHSAGSYQHGLYLSPMKNLQLGYIRSLCKHAEAV